MTFRWNELMDTVQMKYLIKYHGAQCEIKDKSGKYRIKMPSDIVLL